MSRIKSKNTVPELTIRSMLHKAGYRFRIHVKNLPGKPDILLPKYHTVILVNGCFWHRHKRCKRATTPTTNIEYWNYKFQKNIARDKLQIKSLKKLGLKVITVWECEISKSPEQVFKKILSRLSSTNR